jgi:hypothetical protein
MTTVHYYAIYLNNNLYSTGYTLDEAQALLSACPDLPLRITYTPYR